MGGEGNTVAGAEGIFNDVEVFDTKAEAWRKLDAMRLPRHGGSAVAVNDGIYLPGGGTRLGGSPVDVLDVYWP